MADADAADQLMSELKRVAGRGRRPLCTVCNTYAGKFHHPTFDEFKFCTECAREFLMADFDEVDDDGNQVCCSVCGALDEDQRPCQEAGCTRCFCVECLVNESLFALDRNTLPAWGDEFTCPVCAHHPVDEDKASVDQDSVQEEEEEEDLESKKRKAPAGACLRIQFGLFVGDPMCS